MIPITTNVAVLGAVTVAGIGLLTAAGCVIFKPWGREHIAPGFAKSLADAAAGALLGFLIVSFILAVCWAAGDATLHTGSFDDNSAGFSIAVSWAAYIPLLALVALWEEVIYRGFLFLLPLWILLAVAGSLKDKSLLRAAPAADTEEDDGAQGADNREQKHTRVPGGFYSVLYIVLLVPQAALFAGAHADNPHVTMLALANIFFAGVLFGILAAARGSFYTAVGAHFAFNLTYEIYDLPVSGMDFATGRHFFGFALAPGGILGGGRFGLEGGIACTAALLIAVCLISLSRYMGRSARPA